MFKSQLTLDQISLTNTTLDSVPALLAEYKTQEISEAKPPLIPAGPSNGRALELYFKYNGKAYIVTFDANESAYPQLEPVFRRMIQSIRFRL